LKVAGLCDLATEWEYWANEGDKIADSIIESLLDSDLKIRRTRLLTVTALRNEAEQLRHKARQLRGSCSFMDSVGIQ
jgi:hypothetical protein